MVCEDQSVPNDQGIHLNSLVRDSDRNSLLAFNIQCHTHATSLVDCF